MLWHVEARLLRAAQSCQAALPSIPPALCLLLSFCISSELKSSPGTLKKLCTYKVSRLTKNRSYLKSYKSIYVGNVSSSFSKTQENLIVCINAYSCSWSTQPLQAFQLYLTKYLVKPTNLSATIVSVKWGPIWPSRDWYSMTKTSMY